MFFCEIRVTRSLVLYVCFVDRSLSLCTFSFDHCVVCSEGFRISISTDRNVNDEFIPGYCQKWDIVGPCGLRKSEVFFVFGKKKSQIWKFRVFPTLCIVESGVKHHQHNPSISILMTCLTKGLYLTINDLVLIQHI